MKTKRIILLFILMGLLFTSFQCDCTEECISLESATLVDLNGLDGCDWVIQLKSDGTRLEPTNLDEFVQSPVTNQSICVSYEIRADLVSICMVGPFVDIIELQIPN